METLKDLWNFIWENKKWWLFPMILILVLVGFLVVLTAGSAISPFIYTIF